VNADGTLNHGNGVTSVTHIGTRQYEVTFAASNAYAATTINARTQALQAFAAGGQLDSITSLARTNSAGIGGRLGGRSLLITTADGAAYGFSVKLDECWAHLAAAVAVRGRQIRATGDGAEVAAHATTGSPPILRILPFAEIVSSLSTTTPLRPAPAYEHNLSGDRR
jgi:hypothetical protein